MTGAGAAAGELRAGMVCVGTVEAGPDLDGARFAVLAAGAPVPSLDGGSYVTVAYVADGADPGVWTSYMPDDVVVAAADAGCAAACHACGLTGPDMPAMATRAGVPVPGAVCCGVSL